jgi:hypothetical protein
VRLLTLKEKISCWMGPENLVFTAVRSKTRPSRSQSLYRLRYPGRLIKANTDKEFCNFLRFCNKNKSLQRPFFGNRGDMGQLKLQNEPWVANACITETRTALLTHWNTNFLRKKLFQDRFIT